MSKFEVAHLDRFIGLELLRSFMNLVETDPDFTAAHSPEPVKFDRSVTIQFEGVNARNDGQEEKVFLFVKEDSFAVWVVLPDPELTILAVTIFGDVAQAKGFLGDLRTHHDGLLAFRQAKS